MDIQTSLRDFVTVNADDVLRELFLCTGSLEMAESIFPEVFSAALKRGINRCSKENSRKLISIARSLCEKTVSA